MFPARGIPHHEEARHGHGRQSRPHVSAGRHPGLDDRALGDTVRRHRRLAGLSQAELAQLAGVGKTVVFDLEQGKATMRVATVLRLLAALNIRLGWTAPTGEPGDA